MKKSISLILFLCTLLSLCACSGKSKEWNCAELNELSHNFSIALYCSELAIVANTPEYVETIEKEDVSYKVYTVTPNEIIRGVDEATEVKLEAPVDENGLTVLDDLSVDAEYLLLGYRSGENYLVFSPFCVSELDFQGRLVWDNPETPAIENNFPFDELEYIKDNLTTELGDIADDITPELFARLNAQFVEEEENGAYKYWEQRNWHICSLDTWFDSPGLQKYESPYSGTKKVLHYFAKNSPYLDEEDIKNFGNKCLIIYINSHSFESYDSKFIYDFKTDTLARY